MLVLLVCISAMPAILPSEKFFTIEIGCTKFSLAHLALPPVRSPSRGSLIRSIRSSLILCVADIKFQPAFVTLYECRRKLRGGRQRTNARIHTRHIHGNAIPIIPEFTRFVWQPTLTLMKWNHSENTPEARGANSKRAEALYTNGWWCWCTHTHQISTLCTYSHELLESRFPFAPVRPSSSPSSSWFFVLSKPSRVCVYACDSLWRHSHQVTGLVFFSCCFVPFDRDSYRRFFIFIFAFAWWIFVRALLHEQRQYTFGLLMESLMCAALRSTPLQHSIFFSAHCFSTLYCSPLVW